MKWRLQRLPAQPYIINYNREDFVARVKEITQRPWRGRGL